MFLSLLSREHEGSLSLVVGVYRTGVAEAPRSTALVAQRVAMKAPSPAMGES